MNKPIIAKINDKFETLLLIIQAGALIIITIATAVAIERISQLTALVLIHRDFVDGQTVFSRPT